METPIQLIVGLGNPGPKYSETRHNAGAQFVHELASLDNSSLKDEIKFHGRVTKTVVAGLSVLLLIPSTYMNLSGQSVGAISKYYKIPPDSILVVHDELDFPPGVVKFKKGGGSGGHNGLKDITDHLHTNGYHRLRIGIGHPGNPEAVSDYVLHPPKKSEAELISNAMYKARSVIGLYIVGKHDEAMQQLHT